MGQAIIWTNAGILLIATLGTNVSEILSKIHTFSFKKMHYKTSSAKRRPFCFVPNVLRPFWEVIFRRGTIAFEVTEKFIYFQEYLESLS